MGLRARYRGCPAYFVGLIVVQQCAASVALIEWVTSFDVSAYAMMMLSILLLLGMFMDQLVIMLLTVPIFPGHRRVRFWYGVAGQADLVRCDDAAGHGDEFHYATLRFAAVRDAGRRAARYLLWRVLHGCAAIYGMCDVAGGTDYLFSLSSQCG